MMNPTYTIEHAKPVATNIIGNQQVIDTAPMSLSPDNATKEHRVPLYQEHFVFVNL